jgi:hypothetical protein
MNMAGKSNRIDGEEEHFFGISHFAVSVGSRQTANELTHCCPFK